MKNYDVVILGGGPSGMMAAITAAREGARTAILEHKDRVGTKILSTGNGKCNLTNRIMNASCFRSDSQVDFYGVIEQFDEKALIDFFFELGICVTERNGYIYPQSGQAATILDALRFECERLSVEFYTDRSVRKLSDRFQVEFTSGEIVTASRLILCCGGKAAPKTGSDGSGYTLAESLGHSVVPVIPALVKLKCKGDFWPMISGIRMRATAELFVESESRYTETGEIQLWESGISGIPTFNLSRLAKRAMNQGRDVRVVINCDTEHDEESAFAILSQSTKRNPKVSMVTVLNGILPKKLAMHFLKQAGLSAEIKAEAMNEPQLRELVKAIHHFTVKPYDTADFSQAQVCAGGVDLREIDLSTMESYLMPGLYFAGEILDVDGICGGYNLQWAFSSGHLAGLSAAKERT